MLAEGEELGSNLLHVGQRGGKQLRLLRPYQPSPRFGPTQPKFAQGRLPRPPKGLRSNWASPYRPPCSSAQTR